MPLVPIFREIRIADCMTRLAACHESDRAKAKKLLNRDSCFPILTQRMENMRSGI